MTTNQQYKDEALQRYLQQMQQQEYAKRKSSLGDNVMSAYNTLSNVGRTGQLMAKSNNPLVSNAGSNLYKYSGREGLDSLRDKAIGKIDSVLNPAPSNTAMTNTIANNSMANMSAAPTINNPGSYSSLAPSFGGSATPTIANPTAATTIGNFGTEGFTAINPAATSSLSPVGTAVASEASGAGLGAATNLGAIGTEAATTAGAGTAAGSGAATLGSGAALGGAGAAGAAGGAGAAAASAVPIVGWAVAAASLIYNMIKSAQQKKNEEALKSGLEATQKGKQIADQQTDEAMQNLDKLSNEQNQGVAGQLPQLPGTNMQATQPDPSQYRTTGNNSVGLASNVENGAGLVSDLMDMYKGDTPASLPTPTPQPDTSPQPDVKAGLIDAIAGAGRGNTMLTDSPDTTYNHMTPPHIDQYDGLSNTDLVMQANGINDEVLDRVKSPNSETELPDESVVEQQSTDKNAPLKGNLMQRYRDGLSNFMKGYNDNSQNGALEGDLLNGRTSEGKTFGQRFGEAVGTGARLLKNPYLQGTIAGALYGYDKGNALYGLNKGFEWAQNRSKNNAYIDTLRKAGVDVPNTFLGGVTGTDAAAIANLDMLPAKKKYYEGRALAANAMANKNAGLKSDGTPYTYKDLANAYKSKTELNNAIENGEISLDDTFDFNLFQEAVKSRQVGNKTVENNNSSRKLDLIEQGKPTNITQMNVIKSDKDGLKASENYLKGAEIKAGAKGNNPLPQNKSVPSTPAMPSSSNSNALNTNGKTSAKKGAAAKIKEKIDKLYPKFDKNGKRISYTTSGGVNYRIV